jgi:hypothetical protein
VPAAVAADHAENWCRAVADRVFAELPVAVVIALDGPERIAQKLALLIADHLQRRLAGDRSWTFIERATLANPSRHFVIPERKPERTFAEEVFWGETEKTNEPGPSHRPGFGIVRLFSALHHLDEADAKAILGPLFKRMGSNRTVSQAFSDWKDMRAEQTTFDAGVAEAMRADFELEEGGLAEVSNDAGWPVVEAIGSDARLMLIGALAGSEQERVRLLALCRAGSGVDDWAIDAWLLGMGLDAARLPTRIARSNASLREKIVLGVLRIGRDKGYEARALAIIRALEPLQSSPLASIVDLFKEICRSGAPIPVGRLTLALIALALRAQLTVTLDTTEPPTLGDSDRSIVYWWCLMSTGPTVNSNQNPPRS